MIGRTKSRPVAEICADCGASDPSWASINRGLLLCSECCSVHRSLGRHISHVKSLRQGSWPPTLLSMIFALNAQNVNNIWEHQLLDPTVAKHAKRKPQPKDPIHPNKWEFIQAKHVRLAYVLKPRRDEPASELARALHAAVRSSSLDTSMRLLAQGADPNYFNKDKGSFCLHVACRAGQASQAELLVAWGALPTSRDSSGLTPADCARQNGYVELADRMLELCYEVTDRLSLFLTSKKPDHKTGPHFIPPETSHSDPLTDVAKAARGKLQLLPNNLFEELVMDIYDEVDRRETEAVWQTSLVGMERLGVAFLPVNPELSAPRNQGRQKLARLSASEIAALVRDVLIDAARRERIAVLKPQISGPINQLLSAPHLHIATQMTDDEPLYDSVCSDDDYAALVPEHRESHSPSISSKLSAARQSNLSQQAETLSNIERHSSGTNGLKPNQAYAEEIVRLRSELVDRDCVIAELKSQLISLKCAVEQLSKENSLLKSSNMTSMGSTLMETSVDQDTSLKDLSSVPERGKSLETEPTVTPNGEKSFVKRPASMYETREGLKNNWQVTKHQLATLSGLERNVVAKSVSASLDCSATDKNGSVYQNDINRQSEPVLSIDQETFGQPTPEQVHAGAEKVTRCIQELWSVAQEAAPRQKFPEYAERIATTVNSLVKLFPKDSPPTIRMLLESLVECGEAARIACEETHSLRHAAYSLARATKLLLTHYPICHA